MFLSLFIALGQVWYLGSQTDEPATGIILLTASRADSQKEIKFVELLAIAKIQPQFIVVLFIEISHSAAELAKAEVQGSLPVFEKKLQAETATEGETVKLTCTASGLLPSLWDVSLRLHTALDEI